MIAGPADFFSGEICPPRDARRASWRGSRTRGGLFLFRPGQAKSAKSAWGGLGPTPAGKKSPRDVTRGAKFGVGETHTAADRGADAGSRRSPPRELIWINSNIRSSATQTTLLWASRSRRSPPRYRPRGVGAHEKPRRGQNPPQSSSEICRITGCVAERREIARPPFSHGQLQLAVREGRNQSAAAVKSGSIVDSCQDLAASTAVASPAAASVRR